VISVLLVDDHPVVIEGLRKVLDAAGDIDVTGSATDASRALEQARALRPDVILLDLRMPGATGIQATRQLRAHEFTGAIILLTSYGDKAYVRQALEAGADGYLLKSTPAAELITAIRSVSKGRRQLSPELLDGILEDFGGLAREEDLALALDAHQIEALVAGLALERSEDALAAQDGLVELDLALVSDHRARPRHHLAAAQLDGKHPLALQGPAIA